MTSPTGLGGSQDAFFLKAVSLLPHVLRESLYAAELVDPGLLAVYPRTHWKELGLTLRGTRSRGQARSCPPMALAPSVSSPTPPSFSPCLPMVVSSSPCLPSSSSSGPAASAVLSCVPVPSVVTAVDVDVQCLGYASQRAGTGPPELKRETADRRLDGAAEDGAKAREHREHAEEAVYGEIHESWTSVGGGVSENLQGNTEVNSFVCSTLETTVTGGALDVSIPGEKAERATSRNVGESSEQADGCSGVQSGPNDRDGSMRAEESTPDDLLDDECSPQAQLCELGVESDQFFAPPPATTTSPTFTSTSAPHTIIHPLAEKSTMLTRAVHFARPISPNATLHSAARSTPIVH